MHMEGEHLLTLWSCFCFPSMPSEIAINVGKKKTIKVKGVFRQHKILLQYSLIIVSKYGDALLKQKL